MKPADNQLINPLTTGKLFRFFIPSGISVFLITCSHIIIQSTLARAVNPAFMIATYATAMSIMPFFERPLVALRQVTSVLVKNKESYLAMRTVYSYVMLTSVSLMMIVAFSPISEFIFRHVLGESEERITATVSIFKILAFVLLFSGIRLFYHGIIISKLQTKWLSIAVVIRLIGMAMLAYYFVSSDYVITGQTGLIVFLTGMIIECLVCSWKGNALAQKLAHESQQETLNKKKIFEFYRPMLLSSFLIIWVGPSINMMLGKTVNTEVAIASFVVAESLLQMMISFFSYTHQVVLQFFRENQRLVIRFLLTIGFIPAILMGIFSYTSLGPWMMTNVIGVNESLQTAVIHTLRVFMVYALLFPILDTCNGLIILFKQNKFMVWSQGANVTATILTLIVGLSWSQAWTGVLGAIAMTLGILVELSVAMYILRSNVSEFTLDLLKIQGN